MALESQIRKLEQELGLTRLEEYVPRELAEKVSADLLPMLVKMAKIRELLDRLPKKP